jgi:hypothetical protein
LTEILFVNCAASLVNHQALRKMSLSFWQRFAPRSSSARRCWASRVGIFEEYFRNIAEVGCNVPGTAQKGLV